MKIAIVTGGTRGDVQPYLAVGRALQDRGHDVWVAAHDEFAPLIRAHGFEHRTMRGSFREMVGTDVGRKWLSSADSPRQYARYADQLFLPLIEGWCEDADRAVEGADGVAFYALAGMALHAAERRKLPAAMLTPWPIVPSGEPHMNPLPGLDRLPGFARRALTHLTYALMFRSWNAPHQRYREHVGLPRYRAFDPVHWLLDSEVPVIHLFSEHVLPRPKDWSSRYHVAGFAFSSSPAPQLPELEAFLERPAVYIGFGSMTGVGAEELGPVVARAVKLAGVRAVVSRGWASLDIASTEDIHVVDDVPHDWLFPRVKAVAHHGGVGTFAEGLRAGKPTVISAFFGDQPFWGRTNARLGTGPKALDRATLTAASLAEAVRRAPEHAARAESIGALLRAEDGAGRAADLLIRHFVTSPRRHHTTPR